MKRTPKGRPKYKAVDRLPRKWQHVLESAVSCNQICLIWTAQEAFGDPKSPGNNPPNEGHGFSRAVNSRTLTASAAEVRFSRAKGQVIPFVSEFVFNATRDQDQTIRCLILNAA